MPGRTNTALLGIFGGVLVLLWLISGIFIVQPAERAVILTFGKYTKTLGPGIHWLPRFISTENTIDVQKIYNYTYPANQDARLITNDNNLVAASVTVQYRIADPKAFLFNVIEPIDALNQATASALQQVIGQNNLDNILTGDREQIRVTIKQQLTNILARYNSGILITDIAIKSVKAPAEVKTAFDDVSKAREEAQHDINQSQIYVMQVEPLAEGQAQKLLTEAKAYKQQVVLQAQANVASYLALLPEYKNAPQVTRERLYIDAIEHVLKRTTKILVDSGNNSLYLPLDKLIAGSEQANTKSAASTQVQPMTPPATKLPAALGNRPTRNQIDYGYGKGSPYE